MGEGVFEVCLDGVELALLESALEMVQLWPFDARQPRDQLSLDELRVAHRLAAELYQLRRALLIAAGVFLPPITPMPSVEYLDQRAAVRATLRLHHEQIHACLSVLRFCDETLGMGPDDMFEPEDWRDFCSTASGELAPFFLRSTALSELANRLKSATRDEHVPAPLAPLAPAAPALPPAAWPPPGALEIPMSRLEFELLIGSICMSTLATSMYVNPRAKRLLAAHDRRVTEHIDRYLFNEDRFSAPRRGGERVTPATPPPAPIYLMPQHLRACLEAMHISELEFVPHWIYFCQTATAALHRFDATPQDFLIFKRKLERLLAEADTFGDTSH